MFLSYFSEQLRKVGALAWKSWKNVIMIMSLSQETIFIWEVSLPSFFFGEKWYIYVQCQRPEILLILVGKIA